MMFTELILVEQNLHLTFGTSFYISS